MSKRLYSSKFDVLKRAQEAISIPLRDIDKTGRINSGKGAIGNILEESWFGYSINNESKPDFEEAGVELKATPYVRTSKGIRAKERLVCNIIDYMKEYALTFQTSSFWNKCNTMLLMSYEHRESVPKGDFTIDAAVLFSFPEEDLIIIEQDWMKIVGKIRTGKAHEISEGDTLYLGACTKGADSSSVRKQPFSPIMAKQRAFSLKQSYMSYILNTYIFGSQKDEHIIKDPAVIGKTGFEAFLREIIKPYFGLSQEELKAKFCIVSTAKNLNELILAKILGIQGKISKTEEFQKANIVPKSIRIEKSGKIRESMSFNPFIFNSLIQEEWEESTLKTYFEQTKFMFIVFRFNCYDVLVLSDIVFWNMPEQDFVELQNVWEKTVSTIKHGVLLREQNGKLSNNLPKQTESYLAHVRPHAERSAYKIGDRIIGDLKDASELPDGRYMTTQSFWLNNEYILKQLKNQ